MIEKLMGKARDSLANEWVPENLGFSRIDREFLKSHMTAETKELFCSQDVDRIIVIIDRTYIYIQKSSNYAFQW